MRGVGGQTEHQTEVLHRRTGRALAQVVEPRHQHRLPVGLVSIDGEFQQVGLVQTLRLEFAISRRGVSSQS